MFYKCFTFDNPAIKGYGRVSTVSSTAAHSLGGGIQTTPPSFAPTRTQGNIFIQYMCDVEILKEDCQLDCHLDSNAQKTITLTVALAQSLPKDDVTFVKVKSCFTTSTVVRRLNSPPPPARKDKDDEEGGKMCGMVLVAQVMSIVEVIQDPDVFGGLSDAVTALFDKMRSRLHRSVSFVCE